MTKYRVGDIIRYEDYANNYNVIMVTEILNDLSYKIKLIKAHSNNIIYNYFTTNSRIDRTAIIIGNSKLGAILYGA